MVREDLSIGDLAKATDTKVETIRYYERISLLPAPERTSGNYRSYSATHLGHLSFIRRARDLGFSPADRAAILGAPRTARDAPVDGVGHRRLDDRRADAVARAQGPRECWPDDHLFSPVLITSAFYGSTTYTSGTCVLSTF